MVRWSAKNDNPLLTYFLNNDQRVIYKWMHYFDIYHRHFERFQNQKPTVLEIGVFHGGSLQMWKHYFGEGARIVGLDINPVCKQVEEEGIEVFIGDQEDSEFLKQLAEEIGPIDILIDDGGHSMSQQITTFESLFTHITADGVYLTEDTHTSYSDPKNTKTFIEFSKKFVDHLHARYYGNSHAGDIGLGLSVDSVNFYDSIVVFEKKRRPISEAIQTGKITL